MSHFRILLGLFLTSTWLTLVGVYVWWKWAEFAALGPNSLGDFVAGSAGPVAFLWLVLGYFQQGEELRQNTAALNLQAEELRESVAQQKALVEATNRQHAFDLSRTEQERRTSFHAGQPLFEAHANWEKESSELVIFQFTLKNFGERCTKVSVKFEGGDDHVVLTGDTVLSFEQGAQRRWRIRVAQDSSPLDQTIIIQYTDANGDRQTQKVSLYFFKGGDSDSKLLASVDGPPEQIYPWDSQSSLGATS